MSQHSIDEVANIRTYSHKTNKLLNIHTIGRGGMPAYHVFLDETKLLVLDKS